MGATFYGRPNEAGEEQEMRERPDDGTETFDQIVIGEAEVRKALDTLQQYKEGKANLEQQIIEDELWYQMRHWDVLRRGKRDKDHPQPEPASGWLFNALANKHADAMDNIPEANVLPRERRDEQDAKTLSEILPVIMERSQFEDTYSENWWEKLKHGWAVYSVLWDQQLDNGLGDIAVRRVDALNIYWEPGVEDLQDSRNVFVVTLADDDILEQQYPQLKGKLKGNGAVDVAQYVHDDTINTDGKSAVIDWYYKEADEFGVTRLHYVKIIGEEAVYASQNDPERQAAGWYEHGKYPFVVDVMFPEKATPVGFGMIAICKDPELYIDKISANVLETTMINAKTRYFAPDDAGINEDELLDVNKPVVHYTGSRIPEEKVRQINGHPLDGAVLNVLQMKVDEMKETSANRDVNQGGASGGATAAAAIAALQEAGNKISRDIINASFRKYTQIGYLVIELIRQFYDIQREFRITGEDGSYEFVPFDNSGIKTSEAARDSLGNPQMRTPVFDIQIRAQKKSPFAREAQNQRALEMYTAGFFSPENATPALACLEMMDFEGIEKARQKIAEGQTMMKMIMDLQMKMATLLQAVGEGTAAQEVAGAAAGEQVAAEEPSTARGGNGIDEKIADAQNPAEMTKYGQRLAAAASPTAGV